MTDKKFVGRGQELSHIQDWLQRPEGGLILITGAGGIGKTSLLRKIVEEYSSDDQLVVEYFDLAEQPATILSQAFHLAHSLGFDKFPAFERELTDLETGYSELSSVDVQEKAVDTCVREVIDYLKKNRKKLLRITDTFEIALKYKLYVQDWARGIDEKFRNLARENTFFIIAGRDEVGNINVLDEIVPAANEIFGKENILHLRLSGFDKTETDEFYREFDKHHLIPEKMREKLPLLTSGRPILLSLAVEWLQNDIPLPVMIEKSLVEIKELIGSEDTRKTLYNSFEFELISRIRQLRMPLDLAVLYMAHIDRRMDSQLLSVLLDVDIQKAEEFLADLLRLSFVKEFIGSTPKKCTLHDEMRLLVNKHAWNSLDISGEERKRLTRKVIKEYYQPRIDELKQRKQVSGHATEGRATLLRDVQARSGYWERWLLEAETVYYCTKLSEEDGFSCFDQVFYDKEESPIRDQFLLDELKKAGLNKDKVALREADDLVRRGKVDQAKQICSVVLEKGNLDDIDRIHGYITLGSMDFANDPIVAEKNFMKALELAKSKTDLHIQTTIYNNLGRLFRNTSQLEKSITNFNEALKLAYRSGNPETGATARNNLAWTYRLNGDLDEADAQCRLSIAENRKRGQERPLAYAYLTKADIERDRGDLQDAERHAKQALELFIRLDDKDGEAQAYRTLANIFRYLHKFEQALRYLEAGISLAEGNHSLPLLASLYQLYGRTVRHFATLEDDAKDLQGGLGNKKYPEKSDLFQRALDALQMSIEIAQKSGNRWEIARSQIEIALIKTLWQVSYDEAEINKLLDRVWKTACDLNDELLRGYVYENRARIEFNKGKYLEAGQAFGEAAYHIAQRTGQESTRAFTRLHNFLLDSPISDEQRDALAKGVLEQLKRQDYKQYQVLVVLADMCNEIISLPI